MVPSSVTGDGQPRSGRREYPQLVKDVEILGPAAAEEEVHGWISPPVGEVVDDRHQRREPGAAADQQQLPVFGRVDGEGTEGWPHAPDVAFVSVVDDRSADPATFHRAYVEFEVAVLARCVGRRVVAPTAGGAAGSRHSRSCLRGKAQVDRAGPRRSRRPG